MSQMTPRLKRQTAVSLILLFVPLLITAVSLLMQTQPAAAAVNCTNSTWSVGNETDLNDAITCYNAKPAGNYTITLTQAISLTASSTAINNGTAGVTLLLDGGDFTVDGQGLMNVRSFEIFTDTITTIQNITIINGNILNGGAILNNGTLTISNSTLNDNSAESGGAIFNGTGSLTVSNSTLSDNFGEAGGGIGNFGGSLTIDSSTFSGNIAENGGGIGNFGGTLTIDNSTLSGNSANVNGGGIYAAGTLTVTNSTLNGNSATQFGGGGGGGIFQDALGTTTISNSIIANSSNGDDCGGGIITSNGFNLDSDASCGWTEPSDISNTDPLLDSLQNNGGSTLTHALLLGSPAIDAGNTALTTDQRGIARPQDAADDIGAFERVPYNCAVQPWLVSSRTNLNDAISCYNLQTVANSYTISITQNISLTASSTAISNSAAGITLLLDGGGFVVDGQGMVDVRPFEITTNTTVTMQNITIIGGNSTGNGGGIYNNGILTVNNSTLSNNSANGFGGGGGIYNSATLTVTSSTFNSNSAILGGGIANFDTLIVTNSTFSGNSGGSGGGIYNGDTLTLTNSTLSGNSDDGLSNDGSTAVISNSIVANNSGIGDCSGSVAFTSTGYNLDSDGSCVWTEASDISNSDPLLGPLQDNGGPTFTRALLSGSPAIDAGNTPLNTDQRGVARPQGAFDDIGAFERDIYQLFLPIIISNSG